MTAIVAWDRVHGVERWQLCLISHAMIHLVHRESRGLGLCSRQALGSLDASLWKADVKYWLDCILAF